MTLLDHSPPEAPAAPAAPAAPDARALPSGPAADVRSQPATRPADRYQSLLFTVALVGLVVYHTFGWVWLPALVPSAWPGPGSQPRWTVRPVGRGPWRAGPSAACCRRCGCSDSSWYR